MNSIKLVISAVCALIVVSLIGCGGDTDSGSNGNSSNSGNTGMTYVAGEFKSADVTGQYAPSDPAAYGDFAECHSSFNRHYFETENVLVFGDPSLPDSDFKHAAGLVEGQLQTAFSKTGFSEYEFKDLRPAYSVEVQRNVTANFLVEHYVNIEGRIELRDITYLDQDFPSPENWDSLELEQRTALVASYWNAASREKQAELIQIYEEQYNFDLVGNNTIPSKVLVCLVATMNDVNWGQGTLLGMNIAPNSVASRSDDEQVVLHELIHWIQLNVSTPIEPNYQIHDRWFIEGMATYLAGQKTASDGSGFYPVNVISYDDEFTNFSDAGVAYIHYSKAYQYLYENSGPERIKELLLKMRYSKDSDRYAFSGESSDLFSNAFDEFMLKSDDEQLTLEEFRQNYHSLVE